jgi:signal transduction histidine kinase
MSSETPRPVKILRDTFHRIGFRKQLVLLLLGVLAVTLGTFSVFLYTNFIRVHEFEFDTALYNYSVNVAQNLDVNMFGEVVISEDLFRETEKLFPFSVEKTLFQLISIDGRTIAKSRELREQQIPIRPAELEATRFNRVTFSSVDLTYHNRPQDYRIANLFIDRPGQNDLILQVAAPMILLQKEKRALLLFFFLSIPSALLIAGVLSYSLSKKALSPVLDIISKAKEISAKNLSDRLPVPNVKDELHELATTLNDLLNRLQSAFISQESFVSDASHQLKTPLAILKGELDILKRKSPLTNDEVQPFLESAHEEVRYLSSMVEQLLVLARLESGGAGIQRDEVRMDEIAIEVVSRMQKHSFVEKRQLKIQLNLNGVENSEYLVRGDFDLLRTLMESLIDNAIKYTRVNTIIFVDLEDRQNEVLFRVRDNGDGFSSEDLPKMLARFSRLDQNSKIPGSGLGLSIVQRITHLHGAKLEIESKAMVGSQFSVLFPKVL